MEHSTTIETRANPRARDPRSVEPTGCCPPFDPAPYRDLEITWREELFVKESALCFFYVPLNLGARVAKAQARIAAAGASPDQPLMLAHQPSPWRNDLYIRVTKPVAGAEMVTLPGTYLTRVYEGPYSRVPQWAADMTHFVQQSGRELERLYFAYTTCPACAKAYGKNYVVAFAKVR
ncbi:MAG TPA: hydrolase [Polyangiales bacterium]|nr:hydrolase [Polyangiales bacterium]